MGVPVKKKPVDEVAPIAYILKGGTARKSRKAGDP